MQEEVSTKSRNDLIEPRISKVISEETRERAVAISVLERLKADGRAFVAPSLSRI